jgi:hypothetical protein
MERMSARRSGFSSDPLRLTLAVPLAKETSTFVQRQNERLINGYLSGVSASTLGGISDPADATLDYRDNKTYAADIAR